jgi:hypothetical protein
MWTLRADPYGLPAPFALALAQVIVEWSRLETAISADLDELMKFTVVASLAPEAPRAFNKKCELWKRAIDRLFGPVREYRAVAAAATRRAKQLAKVRNHIIHGRWTLNKEDPSPKVFEVKNPRWTRDGYNETKMAVTQEVLEEMNAQIMEVTGLIYGLIMSRMIHARQGWLTPVPAPSGEDRDRQTPPTDATP